MGTSLASQITLTNISRLSSLGLKLLTPNLTLLYQVFISKIHILLQLQ